MDIIPTSDLREVLASRIAHVQLAKSALYAVAWRSYQQRSRETLAS